MRPLPIHPRLVLRRRGANGRHVPAQPRRPRRPARRRRAGAGDNQMLPARGPGQQRRRPGRRALGRQRGPDPGRAPAGAWPPRGQRPPAVPHGDETLPRRPTAVPERRRRRAGRRNGVAASRRRGPAFPPCHMARLRHDQAKCWLARLRHDAPRGGRRMTTRITDSALYQHLWGTAESRAVLGEEGRLEGWLEVIVALARAQAAAGVIPASAAALIAEHARADRIDLGYAAEQTRQTSHSTLGLIRALKMALPERCPRVRLHRRHRPGHHRHLDRAGAAPDRRHGLAGSAADRGAAAGSGRGAPVHGDGRPHPRPARQPGDLRLEGGLLGG